MNSLAVVKKEIGVSFIEIHFSLFYNDIIKQLIKKQTAFNVIATMLISVYAECVS